MDTNKKRNSIVVSCQKDFDPILSDCAFFESHSTEKANDLDANMGYLQNLLAKKEAIQILDFGSRTGSFTKSLLEQMELDRSKLELVLVEPSEKARKEAVSKLHPFTKQDITHYRELLSDDTRSFDLILANHAFYYYSDLASLFDQLFQRCKPNGKLLATMASIEGELMQCSKFGFELIDRPLPYHTGEHFESILENRGLNYIREKVSYIISFQDSKENRRKMLRFLFGAQLNSMPILSLLAYFDRFKASNRIMIPNWHYLYVV